MEYIRNEYDVDMSLDITEDFLPLDYTFDMIDYEKIYNQILQQLPRNMISYEMFGLERMIACEVICSAICHKINWDYLRNRVYLKTLENPNWLDVSYLSTITSKEIKKLLVDYNKKERIRERERSRMIKTIAHQLIDNKLSFTEVFVKNGAVRAYEEIEKFFLQCEVFANDPQQKKFQLLIQSMSDYRGFEMLSIYYKPAIDYHLIRLFLRRGIVRPRNRYAYQYIFNQDIIRKEKTIAALRKVCSKSLEDICWLTSLNLKIVNRIEWWVGRSVCINGTPDCYLKREDSKWLVGEFDKCPYYDTCYARKYDNRLLNIDEPKYYGNSY